MGTTDTDTDMDRIPTGHRPVVASGMVTPGYPLAKLRSERRWFDTRISSAKGQSQKTRGPARWSILLIADCPVLRSGHSGRDFRSYGGGAPVVVAPAVVAPVVVAPAPVVCGSGLRWHPGLRRCVVL